MVRIKLNGIQVDIPHEPYPPQIVTMAKLIECFQTSTHALIESPTGTGKSLSILCSALAYYEQEKRSFGEQKKPFKIFICSRTHKQIDQLIEQLRRTSYRPRITVLGSKNHYCINPGLAKTEDKNTACAELIKKKGCLYLNGKDRLIKRVGDKIFDIEDLKKEGRQAVGCPYFASRSLLEDAEVIFAPYNYLIDTNIRETSEINLQNALLIIDEAHNIEDCCRSAGSVEITSRLVDIIHSELINAVKRSALLGEVKGEFLSLMDVFRRFKEHSETEVFEIKGFGCQMNIRKGKEVISELEKIGIDRPTFLMYKNALQSIMKNEDAKSLLTLNGSRFLQELERVLGMVLFTGNEAYSYCFTKYNEDKRYTYSLWLLDPSVMFLPLVSNVKSVSLLSGTLTPFSSFCSELKFQFQHKLIAPHIIRNEQVFVANIKKGHLKQELCGTYNITETSAYLDQISKIVMDIALQVKGEGGTLIFVPSYSFLHKLAARIPSAIVEPKEGGIAEFERTVDSYKKNIQKKMVAIFICVYRGKASEGIDFKDEFARAVIAIGIPYPSIKDPQIGLKKEYNDKKGGYNGRLWYEAQAFRALNQALGRAIRHSKDWGSVFLIDSRYADKRYQSGLSSWVATNMKVFESYTQCMEPFKKFIQSNEEKKSIETNKIT